MTRSALEFRVRDVQPVELAGAIQLDVAVGDCFDFAVAGLVFKVGELLGDVDVLVLQERQASAAGAFDAEVQAALQFLLPSQRGTQHGRVVAAAQAAIGRQDQENAVGLRLVSLQQRMREGQVRGREVGDDLGDLLGVGRRLGRSVHRLFEASRRDQFHRSGDLANVLDRLQAFHNRACFGHELFHLTYDAVARSIDRMIPTIFSTFAMWYSASSIQI